MSEERLIAISKAIRAGRRRLRRCALVACALLVGPAGIGRAEITLTARVTYDGVDTVRVDAGTAEGLREGVLGSLSLYDGRLFHFEVLDAGRESASLRLTSGPVGTDLFRRSVELAFEPLPPEAAVDGADAPAPDRKSLGRPAESGDAEEFIPLLAPRQDVPKVSERRNVSHGRVQVRQMLQTDAENDFDYSVTRVSSSGTVDRLEGSHWSFDWAGDLRYRDGGAFARHPDYQDVVPYLYRAVFHRPVGEDGLFRFGRFLPQQLPGIGYVDGLQAEVHPGEHLRLGVVGGLKPGRIDLEPSANEPLATGYATVEAGRRSDAYYSGTLGLLTSYYDGRTDRLAMLFDQRANLGRDFTLYSTAEVDFDAGTAQTRTGTRLTRLDVTAVSRLSSFLTIQGGADHWERPDHQAERELLPFDDDRFFDDGYWRYWIGSTQNLPWQLRLYEEIAYIDSDTAGRNALWRVRATRTGLFAWRDASATLTLYSLAAYENDGYGLWASGYFPLHKGRLVVQPAAGFRLLDAAPQGEDISLSYFSLHLDGRLSKNWTLFGGWTYSNGDAVDSTMLDVGVRLAW